MAAAATNSAFFMGSTSAAKCREGPAAALQAHFAFRPKTIRRAGHEQGQIRQNRSEEHTSELQSLMRISYAVFCLKNKKQQHKRNKNTNPQLQMTITNRPN